ncbi:MAG: NTP transferase domain-containing protein [Actinomycetia bacterium]|nr:NTP transferase domain-containing protein [Actinomycetes bacterium]
MDLVVMAAGLGSRFGGVKQLTPVGPTGETVMDYAVYDAVRAGVNRVVFVTRRDLEQAFAEQVGSRYQGWVEVQYAFQELDDLPGGRAPVPGRTRPWGTGQAVWAARHLVDGPFVCINADDFYGASAFASLVGFLSQGGPDQYALVGYRLDRTLSEHGTVSRGICTVRDGRLAGVVERTGIARTETGITDTSGARFTGDEPVSMNIWGLRPSVFDALGRRFADFLDAGAEGELYLPAVVDQMVAAGEATVDLLRSDDSWFGVTYAADTELVRARVADLVRRGDYPTSLHSR